MEGGLMAVLHTALDASRIDGGDCPCLGNLCFYPASASSSSGLNRPALPRAARRVCGAKYNNKEKKKKRTSRKDIEGTEFFAVIALNRKLINMKLYANLYYMGSDWGDDKVFWAATAKDELVGEVKSLRA